jgi:hypothetical protein
VEKLKEVGIAGNIVISGDEVITSTVTSFFIISVYHALNFAASNIDNADYT